tara:strand:+ start:271 stop:576 length:306 start_codon:yes stop_codon:yes gene_type:complete
MSKFNKGDLIYIPAETTIFKWSDDSNIPVGPTKTLSKPKRALFINDVSDYYSRVIFDAETWTLKETDIFELKSLPMIKGEQDLSSSRLILEKGVQDGGQTN